MARWHKLHGRGVSKVNCNKRSFFVLRNPKLPKKAHTNWGVLLSHKRQGVGMSKGESQIITGYHEAWEAWRAGKLRSNKPAN